MPWNFISSQRVSHILKSSITFYEHRYLNLVFVVKTVQLKNLFFLSTNIAKWMLLSMGNDFQYYENRIAVIDDHFILQLGYLWTKQMKAATM